MYIVYLNLPKEIWIISERGDQAQDNGLAFFEYLNKSHKQIHSFYLLAKGNKNYEKVKKIGRVLIKGSLKHKIYFLKSVVTATTEKGVIEPWGSRLFYAYFNRFFPKKFKVFLQHGITSNDVSHIYGSKVSSFDGFVTSSYFEKAIVEGHLGYTPDEIINVGMPRYDKLEFNSHIENKRNMILFIPTWRRNLNNLKNNEKQYIENEKIKFLDSDYYKRINELISDQIFLKLLQKYEFEFIFIMHHGINIFKSCFIPISDSIKVYASEEIIIADQLKQAKIFITDYSSIHFDSAYMGNMNIYYQFDKKDFFCSHMRADFFNIEENGFGEVAETLPELLKILESGMKHNCIRSDFYTNRAVNFFEFKDKKNSERLFNQIRLKQAKRC